jgi:hypothetical protein
MEDEVRIGPSMWPGAARDVQPGDLTTFAPHGFGTGAPLVMQPWDSLGDVFARSDYYGFDPPRTGDVFGDAPRTDPAGGTVYFDRRIEKADFTTLLHVMGVRDGANAFAAFEAEATDPVRERFLVQRRIVPRSALTTVFRIADVDIPDELVHQPVDIAAALWSFVTAQKARWGTGMSAALAGTLGGDGDWASEALAFGLMVENADNGIVRIWSRPWLVTK